MRERLARATAALDARVRSLSAPRAVMLIAGLSFAVKLAYLLALGGGLSSLPGEGTDVRYYLHAADTLLRFGSYGLGKDNPSLSLPPGEAVFLAGVFALTGWSIAAAKLAHIALGTAIALLAYLAGRRAFDARVAFWGAVFTAVDPGQAYLAATFLSEPLFTFWMALALLCLVQWRARPRGWLAVGAGVCLGLAGLTRNQGWLIALSLPFGALLTRGRLLPFRFALAVSVLAFAVIAPWTLRNYLLSGQFVLVGTEGGLNLWSGNNPVFFERQPMPMSQPVYARPDGLSEPALDAYYRARALAWIGAHPLEFLANGARKLIVLFSFDPLSSREEFAWLFRLAGVFPYGVLIPFVVVGLAAARRYSAAAPILWYILCYAALAFVFFGDSRMRAPIQPYLYLAGALGLMSFGKGSAPSDASSPSRPQNA